MLIEENQIVEEAHKWRHPRDRSLLVDRGAGRIVPDAHTQRTTLPLGKHRSCRLQHGGKGKAQDRQALEHAQSRFSTVLGMRIAGRAREGTDAVYWLLGARSMDAAARSWQASRSPGGFAGGPGVARVGVPWEGMRTGLARPTLCGLMHGGRASSVELSASLGASRGLATMQAGSVARDLGDVCRRLVN